MNTKLRIDKTWLKNPSGSVSDEALAAYCDNQLNFQERAVVEALIAHDSNSYERWVSLVRTLTMDND